MEFSEFKRRYDALSDITKTRTANALKGIDIKSVEMAEDILKFAEMFDKLVKVGVAA